MGKGRHKSMGIDDKAWINRKGTCDWSKMIVEMNILSKQMPYT